MLTRQCPDDRAGTPQHHAPEGTDRGRAPPEQLTGSIGTGKLADLVVLDQSLFEISSTAISDIRDSNREGCGQARDAFSH